MTVEVLGHCSYIFALCAYLVRDILWLRVLAIGSCVTFMTYVFFRPGMPPDWILISWNGIFVIVNLVQICILTFENCSLFLTEEEAKLKETLFKNFSNAEFLRLFRSAEWIVVETGQKLVVEDHPVSDLFLLFSGGGRVEKKGVVKAKAYPLTFIGEMSFLTGNTASATVVIEQPTRCVRWSQDSLRELICNRVALDLAFKSVLSRDLSQKMTEHGVRATPTVQFHDSVPLS